MTTYTAKNAKRKPGRRRAAPMKPSPLLMLLAPALVAAGAWTSGWAGVALSAIGAAVAAIFLVVHFRHAAWIVTTGADQELGR